MIAGLDKSKQEKATGGDLPGDSKLGLHSVVLGAAISSRTPEEEVTWLKIVGSRERHLLAFKAQQEAKNDREAGL